MATKQTINFGKNHLELFNPPFLEIGSKIYQEYNQYCPRSILDYDVIDYIGIDIEEGKNVDLVCDFSQKGIVDDLNWREKYSTIHCHCVLEHVADIFSFAQNIQDALSLSGILYITVPFAWKIHRIPIDMWRFTPQSIDYLFPNINFNPDRCAFSTRNLNEFYPIDSPPEIHLGSKVKELGMIFSSMIRILRKLKIEKGYFKERALLFESNLMMIGKKLDKKTFNYYSE